MLDAMKGQESEKKLITLLPTEKLRKKFHENIESCVIATIKEKTLSREEMEQVLVRKLLELTNPNSEYDILLFQKVGKSWKRSLFFDSSFSYYQETSTVCHFESKAMKIEGTDEKSLKQLKYIKESGGQFNNWCFFQEGLHRGN